MKDLICIICPRGCHLHIDDNNKVTGNFCPRGEKYAISEMTKPMRSFASFIRLESGEICSIKTDIQIPKEMIFPICEALKNVHPAHKLKIGDIVVENILETGANIVVTRGSK